MPSIPAEPHISYYDYTNQNLKYAYYDGSWHIQTIDSTGDVGSYTSLALDSNNNPHISYFDKTNTNLKYAYYDGSWHIETVDSTGTVGLYTSLALDSIGNPSISYYDSTNTDLKYARKPGCGTVGDNDNDGICNDSDNCVDTPNGPKLGTCTPSSDKPGITCTADADCANACSSNGYCSKNQEDTDNDGVGDVCDIT